ncbi:hypothetical protein AB0323_16580 [Arthrobacter sp. NPDC080031]|uniref:hypothetical protein n=1 Tax=Arthrobacter sp. NPDC080031 TaxID=3155918 RepID=UPI00344D500E
MAPVAFHVKVTGAVVWARISERAFGKHAIYVSERLAGPTLAHLYGIFLQRSLTFEVFSSDARSPLWHFSPALAHLYGIFLQRSLTFTAFSFNARSPLTNLA